MKYTLSKRMAVVGALFFVSLLSGCATAPKPLYDWGHYQQEVYAYFTAQDSNPPEQIAVLEADLEKMNAQGEVAPPGVHAHIGLLYAKEGNLDKMRQEFDTEKNLYPESSVYMDFLVRNFKN